MPTTTITSSYITIGPIEPMSTGTSGGNQSIYPPVEFPYPYQTINDEEGNKMKLYDDAMTEIEKLMSDEKVNKSAIKKIIEKYKGDVVKLQIFKK